MRANRRRKQHERMVRELREKNEKEEQVKKYNLVIEFLEGAKENGVSIKEYYDFFIKNGINLCFCHFSNYDKLNKSGCEFPCKGTKVLGVLETDEYRIYLEKYAPKINDRELIEGFANSSIEIEDIDEDIDRFCSYCKENGKVVSKSLYHLYYDNIEEIKRIRKEKKDGNIESSIICGS